MNKNIEIKRNCLVLFILNIFVLLTLILFRIYFSNVGYPQVIVDTALIINIVILIIGVIFNIILVIKPNLFNERKSLITFCVLFIIYVLLNTVGVVIINDKLSDGYAEIADDLAGYCETYVCDSYETINEDGLKDFIINKTYLDYNGVENEIEIHTKYDLKDVVSVEATVSSQNEMFSEGLIKEQVQTYYNNFGVAIDESLIRQAFDNRFGEPVKKDNLTYKVSEIYEDGELIRLDTIITLDLKQD